MSEKREIHGLKFEREDSLSYWRHAFGEGEPYLYCRNDGSWFLMNTIGLPEAPMNPKAEEELLSWLARKVRERQETQAFDADVEKTVEDWCDWCDPWHRDAHILLSRRPQAFRELKKRVQGLVYERLGRKADDEAQKRVLQADSKLLWKLLEALSDVIENEGAVECLERIVKEREAYKRLLNLAVASRIDDQWLGEAREALKQ